MSELLNQNELATLVAAAPVTNDHAGLLDALHARYPDAEFRLVSACDEGATWDVGIIDREGNRVSDTLGKWIDQELAAAGGDAREVWLLYKDAGLVRTEYEGGRLYLAIPYGPDPDAFFQLVVEVGKEVSTRQLFDPKPWAIPEDRFDLVSGGVEISEEDRHVISPVRYKLESLTNIRRFLREMAEVEKVNRLAQLPEMEKKMVRVHNVDFGPEGGTTQDIPFLEMCPDWLDRIPPGIRFFQDWQESSPGKSGLRLCDHWFITTNDWHGKDGRRQLSLIPQWADADGGLDLPEISPDWEASPYGVMESLSLFDQQAGYSFAWYFYMLHGNRITSSAGSVIAKAIKAGRMHPFQECDERVLLRWHAQQYGF